MRVGIVSYTDPRETAFAREREQYIEQSHHRLCEFLRAHHVEVVDPYDLDATEQAFKRMLNAEGVAMVITRRICAMIAVRNIRPNRPPIYRVDNDLCNGCKICVTTFGCPALMWKENERQTSIDSTLCMGCDSCARVCPTEAIYRMEE